jgi:hypothetical protein
MIAPPGPRGGLRSPQRPRGPGYANAAEELTGLRQLQWHYGFDGLSKNSRNPILRNVVYTPLPRSCIAIALSALAVLLPEASARSCQPCETSLDLPATAASASEVLVARRVGEEFTVETTYGAWDTFAAFEVTASLKGNPPERRVAVAVSGYCLTGVAADLGRPYLLFLQESKVGYVPVNGGCSVRSLPIDGDLVALPGGSMPLNDLAKQLGLRAMPSMSQRWWPYWTAAILACLAAGITGFILGRRRRTP